MSGLDERTEAALEFIEREAARMQRGLRRAAPLKKDGIAAGLLLIQAAAREALAPAPPRLRAAPDDEGGAA